MRAPTPPNSTPPRALPLPLLPAAPAETIKGSNLGMAGQITKMVDQHGANGAVFQHAGGQKMITVGGAVVLGWAGLGWAGLGLAWRVANGGGQS
jgi:hypothetical protein